MTPLAAILRPQKLDEIVGQRHLLSESGLLRRMVVTKRYQSVIFWGPPGTGKTSIVRCLANETESEFRQLNATSATVSQLRKVIEVASKVLPKRTFVFVDEIHRWNKAQQDVMLPSVEDGTIILFGATTEKPKFAINSTILSRCLIMETKPLDVEDYIKLFKRIKAWYAAKDRKVHIDREAFKALYTRCSGDARKFIMAFETALEILSDGDTVTLEHINVAIPDKCLVFDATGNEHFDYAHCYQEAIQHSDVDGAIYWLAKWIESGEDPAYICRRMLITAFEDCAGNPFAASTAAAACLTVERTGLPECMIPMALATCEMAKSERNKSAFYAINAAMKDVRHGETIHVPPELRAGTTGYVKAVNKQYLKGWKRDWDNDSDDRVLVPETVEPPDSFAMTRITRMSTKPVQDIKIMYGIGIEESPGSIGMTHGPSPSLKDMLDVVGNDNAVIVKFVGDQDTILYRWDSDAWVKVNV